MQHSESRGQSFVVASDYLSPMEQPMATLEDTSPAGQKKKRKKEMDYGSEKGLQELKTIANGSKFAETA